MATSSKARRYPRVALPKGMPIAWQHLGVRKIARVGVLAIGGLFIATPDPAPVGDLITIFFEIGRGEVRARARVCDSQPNKGMGVQFTSMAQESRARLTRIMNVLNQEPSSKSL